jgi:hypothetical protein
MFSIPLMVFEAFSMLVIAAQIAALDPLMVTCASTIMTFLLGFVLISIYWATRGVDPGADASPTV